MFRYGFAGAILSLALAGAAAAEPFDDFVNLCVSNDGRRDVVIAKAEQRGWFRMPAEALPEDDEDFRDMVAFLNVNPETVTAGMPADLRMVMVARGDSMKVLGVASLELEACAMLILDESSAAGSWSGQLDQTLGFGATWTNGQPLWVFSREGSQFRSEADLMDLPDDQLIAIAKRRDLFIAGVLDEEFEGLLFAAIRPVD